MRKHSIQAPVLFLVVAIALLVNTRLPAADDCGIAIVNAQLPGTDKIFAAELVKELRASGCSVTELSASDVCDEHQMTTDKLSVLIIPNCSVYPAAGIAPLHSFASQGRHVFFIGGPFLDRMVWKVEGKWLDRSAIEQKQQHATPTHFPFGEILTAPAGWMRTSNDPRAPAKWETVTDATIGKQCYHFWTKDFTGWDGHLSPPIDNLFGLNHDLFRFRAKGAPQTKQLAVEIQESDGSRWIAVVQLTDRWQQYGLEPADFHYWPNSATWTSRGNKGDLFRPEHANRVNFQIAHSHTAELQRGEHAFWLTDIGTCENPVKGLPATDISSLQSLETILPRYKVHRVTDSITLQANSQSTLLDDRSAAKLTELANISLSNTICPIARTTGRGFDRGQRWRYIPLVDGVDRDNQVRGAAAWLLLNRTQPFQGSIFAGLGINEQERMRSPQAMDLSVRIVHLLNNGIMFSEAGTEHFFYWSGELPKIGAVIRNIANKRESTRLRAKICALDGKDYWTSTTTLSLAPKNALRWTNQDSLPALPPATYRFSAQLLSGGDLLDEIDHEFVVQDVTPAKKQEFMRVVDGDFYLGNQKWYPVGINYWPLYVSGMDRNDFWAGWLRQSFYDPALVEEDLVRLQALGINLVSIQPGDVNNYRNLLDFTSRCARHDIFVNLFCGLASPIQFQEEKLREFIETPRLADNSTIMAYDTIWEPGNYVFSNSWRKRWDADWRAWVIEQYGSEENAEKDWRFSGRRDPQGKLISPGEANFRQDGPWRIMMAAYRRFMDDLTSRKWGHAHRRLRQLDPNHLVSFRQGNTLPHDFVFTGTPKHVDFMCPEGYSIPDNNDGYDAAGFITRLIHFTTRGKPIIWSEFGKSVWNSNAMEPSSALIRSASDYHELFYRMVLESGANGTVPWWWPGGYRVGERSDYGIISPVGQPRPAARLIQEYGPRLKTDRKWPSPTEWFQFDRDAHAGGYWHTCFDEGKEAYRKAIANGNNLGIRTAGTGTTSATAPRLAVGNRPWTKDNPAKYLNAEFNSLLVKDVHGKWIEARDGISIVVRNDAPVIAKISVGNTQEATWIAGENNQSTDGDVILKTTSQSGIAERWPLPETTPYLSDADFGEITLVPSVKHSAGVELRMSVVGGFGFGEKRTFRILVKDN